MDPNTHPNQAALLARAMELLDLVVECNAQPTWTFDDKLDALKADVKALDDEDAPLPYDLPRANGHSYNSQVPNPRPMRYTFHDPEVGR